VPATDIEDVGLIDHHCHGVVRGDLDRAGFEGLVTESHDPPSHGMTNFDTPLGLAVRRWCAPILDLEPFVDADAYVARRDELGADEVSKRFFKEAGLAELLIDTGYRGEELHDLDGMAALTGLPVREIVRLEAVTERVASSGVDADRYADAFADALANAARDAVGFKTIAAYRGGFAFEAERPSPREVAAAAGRFLDETATGASRVRDPVLIRHGIWTAADLASDGRMPIQFHTGWGDPDLVLHLTNPSLLTELIRKLNGMRVNITLLHCYPFHRDAAYLSAMYANVYFDVGSALHYHGPSSGRLLAEAMEVAPFTKLLFSTDAFGLPEQYYLGSMLYRRALRGILDRWIAAGDCDDREAGRIARLIGRDNALRIYPLDRAG
jgi:uncharacterized protein